MKVEIRMGDLSAQTGVDALVVPANTELFVTAGVAGAVGRRGGPAIEQAARALGPVALGDVVATPAGELPVRHVLHAAVVGFRPADAGLRRSHGSLTSEAILHAATTNTLRLAESLGCRSLALPSLGGGTALFPMDAGARVMLEALRDHVRARPETPLERLLLVLLAPEEHGCFQAALDAVGGAFTADFDDMMTNPGPLRPSHAPPRAGPADPW